MAWTIGHRLSSAAPAVSLSRHSLFRDGRVRLIRLSAPRPASGFFPRLISLHAASGSAGLRRVRLSAVDALMYLTQETIGKFHKRRAIFSLLPPIQRLDAFRLLSAGRAAHARSGHHPALMKEKYGVYFKNDPLWIIPSSICFLISRC